MIQLPTTGEVFKQFKLHTINRVAVADCRGMWTLGGRAKLYRAQPITQGLTTGLQGFQVPACQTTDWLGPG
jgi:hypothetical protein